MFTVSVTGSTAARSLAELGGAPCYADGAVVLRRVHESRVGGLFAAQRTAQLADEALHVSGDVDVHDLARERRPVAMHAAIDRVGVLVHATPQNGAFQRE